LTGRGFAQADFGEFRPALRDLAAGVGQRRSQRVQYRRKARILGVSERGEDGEGKVQPYG
jgi:hypothetical protein